MKKLFYLAVFITLFSCKEDSTSREGSTSGDEPTEEIKPAGTLEPLEALNSIDDIKKEHSYITSQLKNGSLDSVSFDYNCNGEKKGKLTYFHDDGQLRLIRHTYNEYSHFSATDEYFLKDGAPFFIFYNRLSWNFVDGDQTKDDIKENRIYLIDNRPVKCLQKEFTILSNAEDNPESDKIPNKEVECSSLEPILEDFEMLFKLRNQQEDLDCL